MKASCKPALATGSSEAGSRGEAQNRTIDRLKADLAQARELLECLVDDQECWLDHHGGCQAHGFLSLQPGEICPHAEARQFIGRTPTEGIDADER